MNANDAKKRIALLGMHLESNAFAPVCEEASFRLLCYLTGDDILADLNKDNPIQPAEISGFVDEMDRTAIPWEPVPILVTCSEPSGPCEQGFFDATMGEMRRRLTDAGPLDGVFFSAHGGMTATVSDDPDGELFEMARSVVGPGVPLVATLDLHANISETMVEQTDVLISYVTNPHVDQQQRAQEAARVMTEMFEGMKPEAAFIRLPIVAPTVTMLTAQGPYADLIDYGQQAKTDAIVNVSVVGGFAFSDLAKNGLAVIVKEGRRTEISCSFASKCSRSLKLGPGVLAGRLAGEAKRRVERRIGRQQLGMAQKDVIGGGAVDDRGKNDDGGDEDGGCGCPRSDLRHGCERERGVGVGAELGRWGRETRSVCSWGMDMGKEGIMWADGRDTPGRGGQGPRRRGRRGGGG